MAIVDSIFGHARADPARTAVIQNGRALGYGALAGRIAAARAFLAAQPLDLERTAVICVAAPLEAWIVGLALRSLGATTIHARSSEDIARLGVARPGLIASGAESWPGLAEAAALAQAPLITMPATAAADLRLPASDPAEPPGGHVLLTSGTTGAYKKVLVSPALEAWNQALRAEVYGLSAASVVNVFDFGGWTSVGHHLPICVWGLGGAVVLHQGPDRWRSLAAPGLSLAYTQPQLLADLLAAPPDAALRNDAMTLIVTSGALAASQWRAARERLTADIRTCIGSTEAGVVTITPIERAEDLNWHRIHPGCDVQVVDEADRPAPVGETGVVRVLAVGVDGYLDDPEASAAFFRGGYFYPGDLGVLRADGRLSLQGRVTDVINVMGDKLATRPIEAALEEALGAAAVCIFSAPGEEGEEVVHVAIQPARPITAAELKAALARSLPGVTRARAHRVEALPRNHMGKIERATLKAMLLGPEAG